MSTHKGFSEQDRAALISATVQDLLCVTAGWDLLRLLVLIPVFAENARPAVTFVLIKAFVVEGIPFVIWRRGKVILAAWLIAVQASLASAVYVLLSGGLRSSGVLLQMSVVVLTAIAFGYRGILAVGGPSLIFLGALTFLEASGVHLPVVLAEPTWAVIANIMAAATLALVPTFRAYRNMHEVAAENSAIAEDLAKSRANLDDLIQTIDGIVWQCDARTWRFTFISQKAERLLGYPVSAWLENPDFRTNHMHPEDRSWVPAYCKAAAANGRDYTLEYRMIAANGGEVWLRDLVTVVSENGMPVLLRGVMIDTTEVKRVREEIEEKELHLRAILDSEPACVQLIDEHGTMLEINPAGMAMIEADSVAQVVGKSVCTLLSREDQAAFLEQNRKVFEGKPFTLEYVGIGFKGTRRCLETHAAPFRDRQGNIKAALCVTRDVTERKKLETELRTANSRLLQAKSIAKLGYFIEDLTTGEAEFGVETFHLLGLPVPVSLRGSLAKDFDLSALGNDSILYGDAGRLFAAYRELIDQGKELDITFVLKRPDGEVRHIHARGTRELDTSGKPSRILGVLQDITEHRQVLELLHRLSGHQEAVREQERMRIAREIHDELGQQLTGLKMQTAWVNRLVRSDAQSAQAELETMEHSLEATIRTVRRIVTDLRPPVLDTLGVIAALEWLREKFEREHKIHCVTLLQEDIVVNPAIATAIFRVAQEALTNVAKHSKATRVEIRLAAQNNKLILEVDDDGPGMRETVNNRRESFGLIGMQERARLLHGTVDFLTSASGGVLLRLTLPHGTEIPHVLAAHR